MGPIVAGYIFDALGSYTVAFIICAVLAFTGLVSTLFLQKQKRPQTWRIQRKLTFDRQEGDK
jgi:cyanate permease